MKYLVFDAEADAREASAWLDARVFVGASDVGGGRHAEHGDGFAYCPPFARWDGGAWAIPIDDVTEAIVPSFRASTTLPVAELVDDLDAAWIPPPPNVGDAP